MINFSFFYKKVKKIAIRAKHEVLSFTRWPT